MPRLASPSPSFHLIMGQYSEASATSHGYLCHIGNAQQCILRLLLECEDAIRTLQCLARDFLATKNAWNFILQDNVHPRSRRGAVKSLSPCG